MASSQPKPGWVIGCLHPLILVVVIVGGLWLIGYAFVRSRAQVQAPVSTNTQPPKPPPPPAPSVAGIPAASPSVIRATATPTTPRAAKREPIEPLVTSADLPSKGLDRCYAAGETAADKEHAERLCAGFRAAGVTDLVLGVTVRETIIHLDITKAAYRALVRDRVAANTFVGGAMDALRKLTGSKAVTAWLFVGKVKAIEGSTTWTGENTVKFLIE